MRLISAILMGAVGFTACSKSKDDDPETKDPIGLVGKAEVLPLDGAKWASFMSIPWEKRCEGIQDAVETFQKNNLTGFVIAPRPKSGFPACMVMWSNVETAEESYEYRFRLSKDGKDFDFDLRMSAGPRIRPNIGLVTIFFIKGDSSVVVDSKLEELNAVHTNFRHLDKTLDQWSAQEDVEAKIFGRPYSQYLSEISSTFRDQGGFILKNPDIKMKLTMDAKVPGKGTAEFLEADSAAFSPERGPLLGCNDFNCLKGSTVEFQALGTKFLFDRVIEEQTGGTTLVGTWHYDVKSWPLTFE
jgi:hypothetical protein